jgi:hypothetical protein
MNGFMHHIYNFGQPCLTLTNYVKITYMTTIIQLEYMKHSLIISLQLFYYNYIGYLCICSTGSKGDTRSHKCYFTLVLHVLFPKNDFFIQMIF